VAVKLAPVVETFRNARSTQQVRMTVRTPERTYQKDTTVEDGLRSMLGIYMVTSNCPVMDELRPNVRFHLPFASGQETVYRAIAMYLVSQYFRSQRGEQPDWELRNLRTIYELVSCVNQGISRRLLAACQDDANLNAVVILSTFGESLRSFLAEWLDKLERLLFPFQWPVLRRPRTSLPDRRGGAVRWNRVLAQASRRGGAGCCCVVPAHPAGLGAGWQGRDGVPTLRAVIGDVAHPT
jgi:hypothetical protein